MAGEGRPNFDLSSFATFTFPPPTEPEGSTELKTTQSAESHDEMGTAVQNAAQTVEQPSMASDDDNLIDLTKFGPPDALTELDQNVSIPATVVAIIETSIETVRTQLETEHELVCRFQDKKESEQQVADREELQSIQEEDQSQAADHKQLDKGKGVDRPPAVLAIAPQSQTASDRTTDETPPFYTPS